MARKPSFPKYPASAHKSGLARITIKGRDFYLGKHGSPESYAEYARLAKEFAAGIPITPRLSDKPCTLTVAGLIASWSAWERDHGRGNRHPEVQRIARAAVPLDRLFGNTRADEFTAKRLEQVQLAMRDATWMTAEEKAKLPKWSRNYVNRQVDRCIRIFRWAEKEGLVPIGTLEHLRTLEPIKVTDHRARHTLPRTACDWNSQVAPCLAFMTPAVRAMVEVQWLAGMRPGEVVSMTRGDIDRKAVDGVWLYCPRSHKNTHREQELVKVIGPRAQTVLAPWMLCAGGDDMPLFCSRRKGFTAYTIAGYDRAISRACRQAGVKAWTPYLLRYDAERRAEEVGGLAGAGAHLGHRHLETTKIYAERQNLELAAEVARKIG